MYIQIQMRQDHVLTCIPKYPISKIIINMWISNLTLYIQEKRQRDDNSIVRYLTYKSTNIHISTKCQIPKNQVSTYHQVSISTSKIFLLDIYKNLPLTPIIKYKNLSIIPITWFQ